MKASEVLSESLNSKIFWGSMSPDHPRWLHVIAPILPNIWGPPSPTFTVLSRALHNYGLTSDCRSWISKHFWMTDCTCLMGSARFSCDKRALKIFTASWCLVPYSSSFSSVVKWNDEEQALPGGYEVALCSVLHSILYVVTPPRSLRSLRLQQHSRETSDYVQHTKWKLRWLIAYTGPKTWDTHTQVPVHSLQTCKIIQKAEPLRWLD